MIFVERSRKKRLWLWIIHLSIGAKNLKTILLNGRRKDCALSINTLCSGTQPHRDTVAAHQIPLVTFFCVSMYGGTARGIGTYLERFLVKIPDYFCLSTYHLGCAVDVHHKHL